jgi:RNA polymerase sigma-70 factor (ECF subfamily)
VGERRAHAGALVEGAGSVSPADLVDFEGLYRAHAKDVQRFALFLSGRPEVADDLVSETFVRLWHARRRLDLTTVRGYLLTIARNLYLQQQRQRRRREALHENLVDPRPGPDVETGARDDLRAVLAALQTLPEIDRSALLMRADDGLSYAEIGASLGISEVLARVKVHRARLALAAGLPPSAALTKEKD